LVLALGSKRMIAGFGIGHLSLEPSLIPCVFQGMWLELKIKQKEKNNGP
jgi:hypothetical protein